MDENNTKEEKGIKIFPAEAEEAKAASSSRSIKTLGEELDKIGLAERRSDGKDDFRVVTLAENENEGFNFTQKRTGINRGNFLPPIDTKGANKVAEEKLNNILLVKSPSPPSTYTTNITEKDNAPRFVSIGVATERNRRYRRSMEDSHSFVYNFCEKEGQFFSGIFDGHAGKDAAEWCGLNFHSILQERLMKRQKDESIPEIINNSFLEADAKIKQECKARSGCTAVIAFVLEEMGIEDQEKKYKLYTANVGDARATLGRNEDAARMTYDHKGEDFQESLRITENGGFMINNRVNGVLAVTRALGDSTMKRVVVGNPYVTVTTLDKENDVLILACDGLWDVCTDEQAVEIARNSESAELASSALLNFAMDNLSTDNISIIVVRLDYFS